MRTRDLDTDESMARFLARYAPGPLPVDVAIARSQADQKRPGILSGRSDLDEEENDNAQSR